MDTINQHRFLRLLCFHKVRSEPGGSRSGNGKCRGVSGHRCYLVLCSGLSEAEAQPHADLKDPYWYDLTEKGVFLTLSHVLTTCCN